MSVPELTSLIAAVAGLIAATGTALNYRSLARARETAERAATLAHDNNRMAQAQRDRLEQALGGGVASQAPQPKVDS